MAPLAVAWAEWTCNIRHCRRNLQVPVYRQRDRASARSPILGALFQAGSWRSLDPAVAYRLER
jgi:hypothetical protein